MDASSIKDFGNVVYIHGETDVTDSKANYFNITEDGNRRIITQKDDTDYNVTIADNIEHGTVIADKTTAKAGELVALTVTPASGYSLQSLTVKDASDNDVSLSNSEFIMPKGGVTVSATFIQSTAAFNNATGVLTLNGNVVADEVKAYGAVFDDFGDIDKYSPVTSVVCEPGTVLPADCSEMFLNFYNESDNNLTIDLSNADVSGVTNMSRMFGGSLTTIYVNSAWSMANVTSSNQMFYDCMYLEGGNETRWTEIVLFNGYETAMSSTYAVIDGKKGQMGYLTVKPKQTPSAPTANVITYTGEAQELVTAGDGTMLYSLDDETYSTDIPKGTAAGTYTVYYTVEGSDNWNDVDVATVEATIAKATPTVTAPTAKTLNYNGNEQELVTAGSANFGTVLYSLDGTNYSEDIPKGTDAKAYTVYYKVDGSDNYYAIDANTLEVSVNKAVPAYTTPTDKTISCNQTLSDITLPDGFTFANPAQALNIGPNEVKLIYTPADTANYSIVEDIVITVNKEHKWDEGEITTHPTCTEKGVKTYTCTICHETKTEEIEPAHHLTATAAKEATCTETGNSAYWTCDVCGKHFSDADGKTEIAADSWVIPAGHHLTATTAKAATCTEAGNSAYWTCDVCGKHFSDAEGKTEIEEDSWVAPALGHKWGEWKVVKEATETEEGLEERVCENDPTHTETRPIPKKEKAEPANPENPETPVNPENPETPVTPENPDTPDTPVQPETPKPDTQIPLTPSVNKSTKINDADVSVSINITYPKAVNWTGSKITQAQLAVLVQDGEIAKVKIEGLEKAIAALNKDADLNKLIKVSYVIGKKRKVGEKGSFYVKISLNSKVCKKAKIKGKDKKALETLIKDINKEFKAHPYEFDIVPIDLNDADAIESVSIKAAFKNGELQLNDDGTIKKIKSLKIKVKIPGKKKAKTYSFSGKKITQSFTIKLTDPTAKKAEITALDGQNFKGSRSGVEITK